MRRSKRVKGIVHSRYTAGGNKIRKSKRMRRGSKLALVIIVAVMISVIFAIFIGNLLNKRSRDVTEYFETVEPIQLEGRLELGKSVAHRACGVNIGDSTNFKRDEYSAVSFFVNDGETLLYNSATAAHFGKAHSPSVDLGSYVSKLKNEGYSAIACFFSEFLMLEDKGSRDAQALYERGLISELEAMGVDEVIVFFAGTDALNFAQMRDFLRSVKLDCTQISLGIRLAVSDVSDESAWAEISQFSTVCDYAALDLGMLELSENGGAEAGFVASMRFYLANYNVRILFDEQNLSVKKFIDDMEISNWMATEHLEG